MSTLYMAARDAHRSIVNEANGVREELLAGLRAAVIEVGEAADKMLVLGINHPGGKWTTGISSAHLDEDKAFMLALSARFAEAHGHGLALLAKHGGAQ